MILYSFMPTDIVPHPDRGNDNPQVKSALALIIIHGQQIAARFTSTRGTSPIRTPVPLLHLEQIQDVFGFSLSSASFASLVSCTSGFAAFFRLPCR